MHDMQEALSKNGGVDFVLFTAPCLMGAIESVYELRNCAKVYIGSENLSGYCWWLGATPLGVLKIPKILVVNIILKKCIEKYT
jgi:hypothetical protein